MAKVIPLDIEEYYDEAVEAWGHASLPPLDNIRVTLEPNMTYGMGRAFPKCFKRRNGQIVRRDYYAITISGPWFAALVKTTVNGGFEAQVRDTVLHELAHVACFYMYPDSRVGHSERWKRLCRKVNVRDKRYAWETDKDEVSAGDVTWAEVRAQKNSARHKP